MPVKVLFLTLEAPVYRSYLEKLIIMFIKESKINNAGSDNISVTV